MAYYRVKLECLRCLIRFTILTDQIDRFQVDNVTCPCCGTQHSGFALFREQVEGQLADEVPGRTPLKQFGKPIEPKIAKNGYFKWKRIEIMNVM